MRKLSSSASGILDTVGRIVQLGPRLPGSKAEKRCHDLAEKMLTGLGGWSVDAEEFGYLDWRPIRQSFLRYPKESAIPVQQLGYSPSGDLEGELVFCGGGSKEECRGAEDKMAACSSGWNESLMFLHRIEKYRNAVQAGAKAFILIGEPGHPIPQGIIRKRRHGQIPAIAVSHHNAEEFLDYGQNPATYRLFVENRSHRGKSRNIVGRLDGGRPGILLCAHCDSWTEGAWDNASGVATLLELARWIGNQNFEAEATVCLAGAEEFGLFGSRDFCSRHPGEFAFAINVDGVGLEGAELQARCSDPNLAKIPPLRGLFSELPLTPWGDHFSFHRAGIRTVFLTSGGTSPIQHTHEDRAERLNPKGLESALVVLQRIVTYLASIL